MSPSRSKRVVPTALSLALLCAISGADEGASSDGVSTLLKPTVTHAASLSPVRPTAHPLHPVLKLAEFALEDLQRKVDDYSCLIVWRKNSDEGLTEYQYINAKVRRAKTADGQTLVPFSVFLHFLKPDRIKERQAIYIEGQNAGKMIVQRGGRRLASLTTSLDPHGKLALSESDYPITDIGFDQILQLMIDVVKQDIQHDECDVDYFKNAKLSGQNCTRIVITHPVKRDHFRFHKVEIFVDDAKNIPIRYAAYSWPETPAGQPQLIEEYNFLNVEFNIGLSDLDFDRTNPAYGFSKPRS